MPSKASIARCRAARGVGANGVPQETVLDPMAKSFKMPKTATKSDDNESTIPDSVELDGAQTLTNIAPPAAGPLETSSMPAIALMPPISPAATIDVYFRGASGISKFVKRVQAIKLLAFSKRVEDHFGGLPDLMQRTNWRYAINCNDFSEACVDEFLIWLNRVKAPSLQTSAGTKQVGWSSHYSCDQVAQLYALVHWLKMKPPFAGGSLFNRLWKFFKSDDEGLRPDAITSIWAAQTDDNERLKKHILFRLAHNIEEADENGVGKEAHSWYLQAFAANPTLLADYTAKIDSIRQENERKAKRAQKLRDEKMAREKKRAEALQKQQAKEVKRDLCDRRGVSTISYEEAKALRRK